MTEAPTMTWQPIETAPKDGRWLLTWDDTVDPTEYRACWLLFWDAKHQIWSQGSWGFNPTHWQPLPSPPGSPQPADDSKDG